MNDPRHTDSRPVAPAMSVPVEPPRGERTARNPALDGLRGIAVLMVVVMHYWVVVPTPRDASLLLWLREAGSLFYFGVDLFFVLSGYFIGGILLDHRGAGSLLPAFYLRRGLRIVPIYALLLGLTLLGREIDGLSTMYHGRYFNSPLPDWPFFLFGQNIAMAVYQDLGPHWLSVTWSLAIEEQFYLLLPFAVLILSRRRLALLCLTLLLASPLLRIVAAFSTQNTSATALLLPLRADGLLCGVLCALLVREPLFIEAARRWRSSLRLGLASLTLFFIVVSFRAFVPSSVAGAMLASASGVWLLSVGFSGFLLYVVIFTGSRLARVLAFPPLAWIGLVSYFIYLFHRPVWYTLHWLALGSAPAHFSSLQGALTLVSFLATLAFAALSWRFIERPLLELGRRFRYS